MNCPKCNGSGEMPVTAYEGEQQFDAIINCDRCGGAGELPVFNHERDCGLTNTTSTCQCPQAGPIQHAELCPKASVTLYDEEYHPECTCGSPVKACESK